LTWNKDYVVVIGSNGSGKTTLIQRLILPNIPKDRIFVLNSSRESTWYNHIPKENIYKPVMFDVRTLESFLLGYVSNNPNSHLVLDDVDNYDPKNSVVFKSVIINARHMNIGLTISSRFLQEIPRNVYSQSRLIFSGRVESDFDVRYLATIISPRAAYLTKTLNKYEFMMFDVKSRQYYKIRLKI
jgi:ABC-type lipopolysaccharide export system ATPase subunit